MLRISDYLHVTSVELHCREVSPLLDILRQDLHVTETDQLPYLDRKRPGILVNCNVVAEPGDACNDFAVRILASPDDPTALFDRQASDSSPRMKSCYCEP